jgi:hypothetical protein
VGQAGVVCTEVEGVDGRNKRIGGWERELIIGVVIILLALLKEMFDVTLTLRVLLAMTGVLVVALGVLLLARKASPAFSARLEQWVENRRLWYGALAVFISVALLALSFRVEGLESTVAGLESTVAGDSAELALARATETAQAAEAATLRASLVEQEKEAQAARSTLASRELELAKNATRRAQATRSEQPPKATDTVAPTPTVSAADSVRLYWARVGQGETASAWDLLSPGFQTRGFTGGFAQYERGLRAWLDTLCHVEVARAKARDKTVDDSTNNDSAKVDATMFYRIKPECSDVTHEFEYHLMRGANGDWLIDRVIQID